MKKIFLFIAIAAVISSCNSDDDRYVYNESEIAYFTGPYNFSSNVVNRDLVMTPFTDGNISIEVGSTVSKSTDRSYTITVDPLSTAIPNVTYTLPASNTVVIPSGEYVTNYLISIDYLGVPNEGATLILNLTSTSSPIADFKTRLIINISKICPSFLEGEHAYSSEMLTNGPGGTCNGSQTNTGTVEWISLGDGVYSTNDASFGQFGSCYNDSAAVGIEFQHLCNVLNVDQTKTDQYGDTYTYTIVSVTGSVMILDWVNTYGDSGRVTITREGNEDWQDELQTN